MPGLGRGSRDRESFLGRPRLCLHARSPLLPRPGARSGEERPALRSGLVSRD